MSVALTARLNIQQGDNLRHASNARVLPGLSHMNFGELREELCEERIIPSGAFELPFH
jgi:hypothetical protein